MASCMEAMPIMRSIDFSRATASAICSSSSRFALTAILLDLLGEFTFARRVLGRIVCRILFFRLDVVAVIDWVLLLVGLRHVGGRGGRRGRGGGGGGQR